MYFGPIVLLTSLISAINLIPNGDFEARLQNWGSLWTRDTGAGSVHIDRETVHGGEYAIRIEHSGENDWSFNPNQKISVNEGDLFALDAWIKVEGTGSGETCVVTYDYNGDVIQWSFAGSDTACRDRCPISFDCLLGGL